MAFRAKAQSIARAVQHGVMSAKAGKAALTAALIAFMTQAGFSQSNIDQVVTSLDGYLTAAIAVGVAILLFTLGRAIVRKVAK